MNKTLPGPCVCGSINRLAGCGNDEPVNQHVSARYWLTDLLTRLSETSETDRDADDDRRVAQQVSETRRDDGDTEDARRTAHNPAMTGKPSGLTFAEYVPEEPL